MVVFREARCYARDTSRGFIPYIYIYNPTSSHIHQPILSPYIFPYISHFSWKNPKKKLFPYISHFLFFFVFDRKNQMENLPTYPIAAISTASGGLLYLWGYGAYGQLGFGFDDLRCKKGWGGLGSWRLVVGCTVVYIS